VFTLALAPCAAMSACRATSRQSGFLSMYTGAKLEPSGSGSSSATCSCHVRFLPLPVCWGYIG
jgi:hypothetical protein